jgi:succinate dehydrogenase hydrophobic anchor subunit
MPVQVRKDEVDSSDVYVRFVDILFAVVLGQSFVLLTSKYTAWFEDGSSHAVEIATICLVYGLVVTSWVGYHRSVKAYPILKPYRFLVDIGLLFMYYVAFASAGDFGLITRLFVVVFIAYALWDCLRLIEYLPRLTSAVEERKELMKRAGVSAVFVVALLLLSFFHSSLFPQAFATGVSFVCMLILLALYRWLKWRYATRAIISMGAQ